MKSLGELLAPYAAEVEAEMRRLMPPLSEQPPFYVQIYYHLGWANLGGQPEAWPGGKRVRAAFCLLCCEALAGSHAPALPVAAAIEMLHEFSLIHDDIEDRDEVRRHRPTLWTQVGVAQAINAGDGLFALAQRALLVGGARTLPAERLLPLAQRFNEAALRLCIGQQQDMSFEERDTVSPDEYVQMIAGKTAALLAHAGEAGALAAGADAQSVAALFDVGEAMGIAFQMRDDLLALWGDPARTGKPVGADIRARKKSLPVAYALAQPGSQRLRALYAAPLWDEAAVAEAQQLIEQSGARQVVVRLAEAQEQRALAALERVQALPAALAPLRHLADLLAERDH